LLAKSNLLELLEPILLSSTIDNRVLQEITIDRMDVDGGFDTALVARGLQLPRVALLVVDEPRRVVAFVEILENRREDLGLLVGQRNLLGLRVCQLVVEDGLKEGGGEQDILVGGKDALVLADDQSHNRGDVVASASHQKGQY